MRAQVITLIIVVTRKVVAAVGASILRIVSGRPANQFEREMTDMLNRWVNQLYHQTPFAEGGTQWQK